MRLPELPDNNTDRLFVVYTAAGQQHTMNVRVGNSIGVDGATVLYQRIGERLAVLMNTKDAFLGARFQSAGTLVSLPLPVDARPGLRDAEYDEANMPNFASITGRSASGRDVKLTFFSPHIVEVKRYRVAPTALAPMAELLALVKLPGTGVVTKDGDPAVWNGYINLGVNAYFQRLARRSAL